MEGKIGVVASQVEAVGIHGRHRLTKRRYVATFASAEDVGTLTYAAACELGATEANQQVVLGNGASGVKCAMLSARFIRANAPPNAPDGKSSMRCCFRGSGKVSATQP
jgi:hypothetical protein